MWRIASKITEAIAALCLLASTLMILVNVFYRYVVLGWMQSLAAQAPWFALIADFWERILSPVSTIAAEVPGYLLVWISFFGACLVQRRAGHIAFDMVVRRLPKTTQKMVLGLVSVALLGLFGLLFVQSVRMIWVDGGTEIESAEIAQGWFMLVLPISSALLFATVAADFYRK